MVHGEWFMVHGEGFMVKGCGGLARSEFQSDCKRTKKKKSFVSFVKFVFLNVVDKKLIFAFFVIFDVFTIKNPPRAAGAFFVFFYLN